MHSPERLVSNPSGFISILKKESPRSTITSLTHIVTHWFIKQQRLKTGRCTARKYFRGNNLKILTQYYFYRSKSSRDFKRTGTKENTPSYESQCRATTTKFQ